MATPPPATGPSPTAPGPEPGPEYPFDLGVYGRRVTTASEAAQRWFDCGLAWTYGFHHEEAVRCFERAAEADPGCAMAQWGIAYAVGPNYNKDWDAFEPDELPQALALAHAAITRAQELAAGGATAAGDGAAAGGATAAERALIAALAERYAAPEPPTDLTLGLGAWKLAFAEATATALAAHPDDLDVIAVHADALMNLTAWQLWEVATGAPAEGAHTLEIKRVLERGLALPGGMAHPGLLHLYVHLMEMSPTPEAALPAADALRDLVPDAGHLVHMPTHIDVLLGDYTRVVEGNTRAIAADERWAAFAAGGGPLSPGDEPAFYTLYAAHDHHFRIYGAMFAGLQGVALEAAAALETMIARGLERAPGMADWLEAFFPMGLHVRIRFGQWRQLVEAELPADPELYATTTAMTHYARGVAHAALGQVGQAIAERDAFHAAVARVPATRYLFNNTALDILAVAAEMLDGEIAYRQADYDLAYLHLREAIRRDDTLPYDEPWGWMQPARHAYGALLLEQGHVEPALAVYRADLGLDDTLGRACQHPNNVWSLHGLHECLERLGQSDEAALVRQQLSLAAGRADVEVKASCACRMTAA